MSRTNKRVAIWLALIGLVLVGVGTRVALNWDAVSRKIANAVETQSKQTEATLFRLGELGSIGAELRAEYGTKPDLAYETGTVRTLSIAFSDYSLPASVTPQSHARQIATFAIGKTTKSDKIDAVHVLFEGPAAGSYSFTLDELTTAGPQADPTEVDLPAGE